MRRGRRLLLEAGVVVSVTASFWALIYSPLTDRCCGAADGAVAVALWTASIVGGILTGNLRDPGRLAVLLGLCVMALLAWAIVRGIAFSLRRPKPGA